MLVGAYVLQQSGLIALQMGNVCYKLKFSLCNDFITIHNL